MLVAAFAATLLATPPLPLTPREADLSHTPEVARFREELRARRKNATPHALGASPTTGMTVSDIGRVTVMRDATRDSWEGGEGIDDVFSGTEDSITAFFEAHPDSDADFVVIIQDWSNLNFAGAFYVPLENDTTGIGYQHTAPAHVFDDDPSTPIEGFLWLNGYDFLRIFDGGRILWGQEFGHRWGALVNVDTGTGIDDTVLGRQSAHWSRYLDTDWSWMEGNDWTDNLDGTFTSNVATYETLTSHYSSLDLYLMGLVGTADVPSFVQLLPADASDAAAGPDAWVIPFSSTGEATTVTATTRMLTVQDVIRAEGPRVPSHLTSAKDFDVAIVFALRRDDRITPQRLVQMETLLDEFEQQWTDDTLGLATVTFGVAGTTNAPPVLAAIVAPESVRAGRRLTFDASAATDPEGQPLTFEWRWDGSDDDSLFEPGEGTQRHTFGGEGPRTIEVSVRDAGGAETIVSLELDVKPDYSTGYSCGCTLGGDRAPSASLAASLALATLALVVRRRQHTASP